MTQPSAPVAGIDLGGTKIRIGVVGPDGQLIRAETRPTAAASGPEDIIRRMAGFVRELAGPDDIAAVGLGAPGPINVRTGVVSFMPNLPGWEDYPLRDRLRGELGLPIALGNDGSVAALAEHRYGAALGTQEMVYLSLGTGIGGGIVTGGRLVDGATGGAGELGHMVLDPLGPPCACGNRGCLEAFASGGGIARQARARLAGGAQSTLALLSRDDGQITMQDVTAAARANDRFALELLADASVALGWGIVSLAHLLNPELFVFGGGLLAVQDLLIDPAMAFAEEHMFAQQRRDAGFAMAVLAENAGVLGAAAIAHDLLEETREAV